MEARPTTVVADGVRFDYVAFGDPDEKTIKQFEQAGLAAPGHNHGVLSADAHFGYGHPIGGCIGYPEHVSLSGVGFDIGCGNLAVKTDLVLDDLGQTPETLARELNRVADEIARQVSFGTGRTNNEPVDHLVLDAIEHHHVPEVRTLRDLARRQLGTVGSGNHYVDVFADGDDAIWIGCHFGSRGFGHKLASGFMSLTRDGAFTDRFQEGGMDAPPILVRAESTLGEDYWSAMEVAGRYAAAGRSQVVGRVLDILGAGTAGIVHNSHNMAWREEHFGRTLHVVRKGCTPAAAGQLGFVGGSMGDISVVVAGRDTPMMEKAMRTTVHGAGRVMSRTKAAGRRRYMYDERAGRKVPTRDRSGLVDWGAVRAELAERSIVLRGGAADEAPECYRPLAAVLAAHGDTVEVLSTLTPLVVIMAGHEVEDEFGD